MKNPLLRRSVAVTALVVALLAMLWMVGSQLTHPANHRIGLPPAELAMQDVVIEGVHGWYAAGKHPDSCVLLMHGVYADRTALLNRAELLHAHGYAVLLIDFQAHGETPGENITFGYRESANAFAAVDWLHHRQGCRHVAADGISMGGAAALLGKTPLPVDAMVLESVYPTIEDAVRHRIAVRLGGTLGDLLAPLLYQQLPLRLHVPLDAMHPVDHIGKVSCPLYILAGAADPLTTPAESRRLFDAATSSKRFWLVPGAAHVDLMQAVPAEYSRRLLAFLGDAIPK